MEKEKSEPAHTNKDQSKSPKSSVQDIKNVTAKHSEIFSDEDYETQYLSQVSRHGFFGTNKSSIRQLDNTLNRRSSQPDEEIFEREIDTNLKDNVSANLNVTQPVEGLKGRKTQITKRKTMKISDSGYHKRLQDIAYRIKHHRKGQKTGMIDDVTIKNTQRAGSQNTVRISSNDVTKPPLSQQGVG